MSKAKQDAITPTNRRRFLRLAASTAAATAFLSAPALAVTVPAAPAVIPDPIIAIAATIRKADRRWKRACDARDEAEKASGGPYHYLPPRVVVGGYECDTPHMILSACQPHAPNGPTVEEGHTLAAELRRRIRTYRRRRLAAGLGPSEREVKQAEQAYYAAMKLLGNTPAISLAGIAAKLHVIRNDFRDGGADYSGSVLRSALRDAERLAGKAVQS